jgi:hypothetical protein
MFIMVYGRWAVGRWAGRGGRDHNRPLFSPHFFESCPGVPRRRGIPGHPAPVPGCTGAHQGMSPAARPSCPSPPAHNRKHHHHGVRRCQKLHDGGRQNYRTVDATDNITTGPQCECQGWRGCVLVATHRLLQRPRELNT